MTIFSADAFFTARWALSVLHPAQSRPFICKIWSPKRSPTRDAGVLAWTSCTKSPWERPVLVSSLHHSPGPSSKLLFSSRSWPVLQGTGTTALPAGARVTPLSWRGSIPGPTAGEQLRQRGLEAAPQTPGLHGLSRWQGGPDFHCLHTVAWQPEPCELEKGEGRTWGGPSRRQEPKERQVAGPCHNPAPALGLWGRSCEEEPGFGG